MRAEDVEGKLLAGQRAEKRLLESSEVNDRWRRLTGERRGFVDSSRQATCASTPPVPSVQKCP